MQTTIKFKAVIQNLSKNKILSLINPEKLKEIKSWDDKPLIKAFVIAHEGEADANLIGSGKKIFKYFKRMITKIFHALDIHTPVFEGHEKTNKHFYRNAIGEVIGKALKTIKDKSTAIAAIYIYPEHRDKKLDIASIEADIEYINLDNKIVEVKNIDKITGIALANSDIETPGFPGAKLLGTVQALNINHSQDGGFTMDTLTTEIIIKGVKDLKLKPSDIFTEPELKQDQLIYEHVKRIEKKFGEVKKKMETKEDDFKKEKDDLADKIKKLETQNTIYASADKLTEISKSRKLNEKQIKFIDKNLSTFVVPDDKDKLEDSLNVFIDDQLKEFDEVSEIMGIKKKDANNKDKDENEKASSSTDEFDIDYDNEDDLTNKEKNPMIPD